MSDLDHSVDQKLSEVAEHFIIPTFEEFIVGLLNRHLFIVQYLICEFQQLENKLLDYSRMVEIKQFKWHIDES